MGFVTIKGKLVWFYVFIAEERVEGAFFLIPGDSKCHFLFAGITVRAHPARSVS